jgi:hypothetical protein
VRGVAERSRSRTAVASVLAAVAALAVVAPGHDSAVAGPAAAEAAENFVRITNGKFTLGGRPFVLRGTNYFGSWRFPYTVGSFFGHWDRHKLDLDFKFLQARLNATALRIGTPAERDFASLVRYHGYAPWYEPDGSIAAGYRQKLIELADTAQADHLRIQLCLLWNIAREIAENPKDFAPGHRLDRFYANQLRSVALALRGHPGVMAYSVGNEVLVNWPLNGTHRSWYEAVAAAFIARLWKDLRAAAPRQLLTDDEVAHPETHRWFDPGPEFAALARPDGDGGEPSFRLVDLLDYLGPHFYPETLEPADLLEGRFGAKLIDVGKKLGDYMQAAARYRKPVVLNEFGLKIAPPTLAPQDYAGPRDALFRAVASASERDGVQGLLAWIALPGLVLRPRDFIVRPSALNRYGPIEVDIGSPARRILFYNPSFDLFVWAAREELPLPTAAAAAVASGWMRISPAQDAR